MLDQILLLNKIFCLLLSVPSCKIDCHSQAIYLSLLMPAFTLKACSIHLFTKVSYQVPPRPVGISGLKISQSMPSTSWWLYTFFQDIIRLYHQLKHLWWSILWNSDCLWFWETASRSYKACPEMGVSCESLIKTLIRAKPAAFCGID